MGMIEEVRQVMQDFFAPELREIRGQLAGLAQRMDAMEEVNRARFEKMEEINLTHFQKIEETGLVRFEVLVQRLDTIQQSFAFDKRISDLEADKRRSA